MTAPSTPERPPSPPAVGAADRVGPTGRLPVLPPRVRRLLWVTVALVAAVVILGSPVRGWWSQRGQISQAESSLAAIKADDQALQRRLDRISQPAEVERIARRDLGLVREGEESYTVLPPATAGLVLPDAWPFDRLAPALVHDKAGP